MKFFDEILSREEFTTAPPVLVDVGASGGLPAEWRAFSRHCICIAFDPDDREMNFSVRESKWFKKLVTIPRIVLDSDQPETEFYLTCSPHCSSTLPPDMNGLGPWVFRDLFSTHKQICMKSVSLAKTLQELRIHNLDWFKTDSQGIDVRLFKSIPNDLASSILVAEFEPGFIDAYVGEDKILHLLEAFRDQPFWMSGFHVKGTQRLRPESALKYLNRFERRFVHYLLPTSPCWANITYLRTLESLDSDSFRQFALLWIFSMVNRQWGFALEVANRGEERTNDLMFRKMRDNTLRQIKMNYFKFPLQAIAAAVNLSARKLKQLR